MEQEPTSLPPEPTKQRFPWAELLLYLLGGFGLFSIASVGIGFLAPHLGQWSIVLVVLNNVAFIGGSVWYLGVLRKKTSWEAIGFLPVKWQSGWLLVAIGLSVALMPVRVHDASCASSRYPDRQVNPCSIYGIAGSSSGISL